mmetsp:Transcript_31794/g.74365  ORF Transcript_31794/g.74365 Transcript_31794/m.74365 type:complete len:240 (-) Transcript_31794:355-1074(-)|eukprot:CAMPEP_0172057572 /NCGR_PEP_ID=MMETSP1043-20130122/6397_1 /TAXON_ID=464988 /ORGANISM="Hemiselmis andersenii, Strain CCMP441" /LENGTH=239 /DNA_ID=CAMNT_0012717069 /DNA_START=75 /DNA_END=794 /DNA_ORIENTATION=+
MANGVLENWWDEVVNAVKCCNSREGAAKATFHSDPSFGAAAVSHRPTPVARSPAAAPGIAVPPPALSSSGMSALEMAQTSTTKAHMRSFDGPGHVNMFASLKPGDKPAPPTEGEDTPSNRNVPTVPAKFTSTGRRTLRTPSDSSAEDDAAPFSPGGVMSGAVTPTGGVTTPKFGKSPTSVRAQQLKKSPSIVPVSSPKWGGSVDVAVASTSVDPGSFLENAKKASSAMRKAAGKVRKEW